MMPRKNIIIARYNRRVTINEGAAELAMARGSIITADVIASPIKRGLYRFKYNSFDIPTIFRSSTLKLSDNIVTSRTNITVSCNQE
jgi:hypothetical protein